MRIVMVSPFLGEGFGLERAVQDSAKILEEAGHSVFFLADQFKGHPPQNTKLVPGLGSNFIRSNPADVKRTHSAALQWINEVNPDVVHLCDMFDFRFVKALSRSFPIVLTSHTVAPTCPASSRHIKPIGVCTKKSGLACLLHQSEYGCLGFLRNLLFKTDAVLNFLWRKRSLQKSAYAIAISRYVQQTLVRDGWPEDRVKLVYNPIFETPSPSLISAPDMLLSCAARLVPLKGLDLLVEALATIQEIPWTLWICGEGSSRAALSALVDKLGLVGRIKFLGSVSSTELNSIMAQSRCVLQTNVGPEGFGLSVAEAISLGTPVVGFQIPALNEIVTKDTGILVPLGDKQSLARAIRHVLESDTLTKTCKAVGPQSIQSRFSATGHVGALVRVYQDAVADFSAKSRAPRAYATHAVRRD